MGPRGKSTAALMLAAAMLGMVSTTPTGKPSRSKRSRKGSRYHPGLKTRVKVRPRKSR
jgi:hypothetical protein